jgi:hypothetical protein
MRRPVGEPGRVLQEVLLVPLDNAISCERDFVAYSSGKQILRFAKDDNPYDG